MFLPQDKTNHKGTQRNFGGDGYVYYIDCGHSNMNGHICPTYKIICINYVQFFVYEL